MVSRNSSEFWWKAKDRKSHELIFEYLKRLEERQHFRFANNLRHMRLYSNFEILGFGPLEYAGQKGSTPNAKNRVTLNIIQNMVDTVVSKITKAAPRPRFLTSGGNWKLKRKAEKLTKFIDGQFAMTNFPAKSALAFLDACIFGTGVLKIYTENDQIKVERTFPNEIKIDDAESLYGEPRQMHQVKFIHKDIVKESFPGNDGIIDMIKTENLHFNHASRTTDMIEVIESWHLKSGPEATDGKHVITIQTGTLHTEVYEKSYFPFIFFRWGTRPLGFFGQGLAEQLQGLQLEINKLLRTIQVSMHLTSIPKVFIEQSSKVISSHINNEIGGIIKYVGTMPKYESVGAVPSELFSHLDRLYQRAFEIAGISQLSAQSLKPSGLDSGKALREFNDIESERFLSVGKRYEESFLTASEIMIDMAKDLYASGDISVKVKGDKFLETIKWSEIDLAEDQYIMEGFPASALSHTPAGRLQDIQELLAAGLITPVDGKKLLAFPDLESVQSLENAALDNIEKTIELIVERGKYNPPEPFQNLSLGVSKMQEAYLLNKNEELPEERLELMRRWMQDANSLVERAAQEEAQKQAAIQGAAEGAAFQAQEQAQEQKKQSAEQQKQLDAESAQPPNNQDVLPAGNNI